MERQSGQSAVEQQRKTILLLQKIYDEVHELRVQTNIALSKKEILIANTLRDLRSITPTHNKQNNKTKKNNKE